MTTIIIPAEFVVIVPAIIIALIFIIRLIILSIKRNDYKRFLGKVVTANDSFPDLKGQKGKIEVVNKLNNGRLTFQVAFPDKNNPGEYYRYSMDQDEIEFVYPTVKSKKKLKGGGKNKMWKRTPRVVKWFMYAAVVYLVWHVVINVDNITHFVVSTFFAHSIHTK